MDRALIETYERGGVKLKRAVMGLTWHEFLAFPVPGTWSIQQIVLHLMDSDLNLTDRIKRVIAEENPTLIGFSENDFANKLHYEDQSAADGVMIFELNRKNFSRALRKFPDEAFERFGTHNQRGKLTANQMLQFCVQHLDHHLKFLYEKRAKLGKPLKD